MGISARQIAFQALVSVEIDRSYSNIILNNLLTDFDVDLIDKNFISALFYGVLEKKLLLDYNLSQFSDRPVNKLDTGLLVILRMGLYQIFFMDSVPDRAAVNETVNLCKVNKLNSASGFVNAVLRAASRAGKISLPNPKKGKNKYLSIKYSCPEPIIKLWRNAYGDELTVGMLELLDGRPPISARTNTLKTSADKLIALLDEEGVAAELAEPPGNRLLLRDTGSVEELDAFRCGLFHIQDAASQLCCGLLAPEPGHTVIDACSAPGGKAFTMAQLMENRGRIVCCDMYESRLRMVRGGAQRLGTDIIETVAADASETDSFPEADRILCDVPCSGLGIIRRKPELRYKSDTGADVLPEIQYRILCNCAGYLRRGGSLVYSTCTLNPAENGDNIRRFLREHEDFEAAELLLPQGIKRGIDEPGNELTLFPQINGTDGFFISMVRRK